MSKSTELLFGSPYFSVFSSHKDFDRLNAAMLKSLLHCKKVPILSRANNEIKSVIISCMVFIFTEGKQWQSTQLSSPKFTPLCQRPGISALWGVWQEKSLCLGEAPFYQHFLRTFLQKSMSCTCLHSSPIKIHYLRIMLLADSLQLTLVPALKKTSTTIAFLGPWRTQMPCYLCYLLYMHLCYMYKIGSGSKGSRTP